MKYRLAALVATLFAGLIGLAQPIAAAGHCTISITPSEGASAGETITVSGTGWDADDTVFVNLSGIQIVSGAAADGSGNFSTTAMVPDLNNGDHLVFAFNNAASCEVNSSYPVIDPATTTTTTATTTTAAAPATTAAPVTTAAPETTTTTTTSATTTSTTSSAASSADTTTTTSEAQALETAPASSSSSGVSTGILILAILSMIAAVGLGGNALWSRSKSDV